MIKKVIILGLIFGLFISCKVDDDTMSKVSKFIVIL